MKKFFRILFYGLSLLYSVIYIQHVFKIKYANDSPSIPQVCLDMSIDGRNVYSSNGLYCQYEDIYCFSVIGFGAEENLEKLAQEHAGEKAKLSFRKDGTLLKEGYATIPSVLKGRNVMYQETSEDGEDTGNLSAIGDVIQFFQYKK